jgi:hypothetical protein
MLTQVVGRRPACWPDPPHIGTRIFPARSSTLQYIERHSEQFDVVHILINEKNKGARESGQ